jgi:protein gp37
MPAYSDIEWTRLTYNPVTGGHCQASEECLHCYAATWAERWRGVAGHPFEQGFDLRLWPERLKQPYGWRDPELIFTCSMSDLFQTKVPDAYIARVWLTMGWTGPLGSSAPGRAGRAMQTYQVLTKRPGRMASWLRRWADLDQRRAWIDELGDALEFARLGAGDHRYAPLDWPVALPNVWLGTSAGTQRWANIRVPQLLRCPGPVHFLSGEPLLGPMTLQPWLQGSRCPQCGATQPAPLERPEPLACNRCHAPAAALEPGVNLGLDWLIVGGESGGRARPMHPAWAQALRDQAAAAGVPFLFKQWGSRAPCTAPPRRGDLWVYPTHDRPGRPARTMPDGVMRMRWVGKGRAGRLLDGRLHDGMPAGWRIATVNGRRLPQPPPATTDPHPSSTQPSLSSTPEDHQASRSGTAPDPTHEGKRVGGSGTASPAATSREPALVASGRTHPPATADPVS